MRIRKLNINVHQSVVFVSLLLFLSLLVFLVRSEMQLSPASTDNELHVGKSLLEAGDYSQAVETYTKAIEEDGVSHTKFAGRGIAYLYLRRFTEAERDFTESLALFKDPIVLAYRCHAHRMLADLVLAEEDCLEAIVLDPTVEGAYVNLSMVYLEKGNLAKAEQAIKDVLDINQENVDAHYVLFELEIARGDLASAHDALSKCIEADSNEAACYWERGQLNLTLGNVEHAKRDFWSVIKVGNIDRDGELMYKAGSQLRIMGEEIE